MAVLLRSSSLLPLALSLAGCGSLGGESCTLIGCQNQVDVIVKPASGSFPRGRYTLQWLADGTSATVTCTVEIRGGECENYHRGRIYLEADGSLRAWLPVTPRRVEVRISYGGAQFAGGTFDLAYQTYQPNGPACEPTCRNASVSLTAQPPATTTG